MKEIPKFTETKTDNYYLKYEQEKDSKEYSKKIMKLYMTANNIFSDMGS